MLRQDSRRDVVVTQPLSLRSVLPIEIINLIIQHLSKKEQTIAACVNSVFYTICVRHLYRAIKDLQRPSHWIICLQTLSQNAHLPCLVSSFGVDFAHAYPTGNLYGLLCKVLRRLTSLVSLTIELPKNHSPVWILNGCSFNLQQFTSSFHCKMPLAHFLDVQSDIKDLTLRGFHGENLSFLPLLNSATSITQPDAEAFSLLPESLPRLEQFNAVHAEPSIIATVINGRPVEIVSIPLFPSSACDTFNALELSSRPLKRLSIISFDPISPPFLISEVANRFPDLEALHVVVLMADYTKVNPNEHILEFINFY